MAHVKTIDGYDVKVPSQGEVTFGTIGASAGIASFLGLNAQNLLGGLGWGNCGRGNGPMVSPADMPVSRYEMAMQHEIASKDGEIALLKSNIYTDSKITEAYKELAARLNAAESVLAQQAVRNQGFSDAFRELQKDIDYKVNLEAERRECADCKIVNYANSTFAPKLITDYTAGTTSAVAEVYNPLSCGSCGCGRI